MTDIDRLAERFWARVDIRDEADCWLWMGTKTKKDVGYGRLMIEGRFRPAHRVAWELHHGQTMPSHLHACHHCDNPPCVNPHHIFAGTHSDNQRDAIAKGIYRPPANERCLRGHLMSGDNLYIEPGRGKRACRKCRAIRCASYRKRKKALA